MKKDTGSHGNISVCLSEYLDVKSLEILLEKLVPRFSKPKRELEQYRTPPHIAVQLIMDTALHMYLDLYPVVDAGSGTGMLSYMISCLGFKYVIGLEIDKDAIQDALSSPLYRLLPNLDFVVSSAFRPPVRLAEAVIMNPPFGIKSKRGIDIKFLTAASELSPKIIVSLHSYNVESFKLIAKVMRRSNYCCKLMGVYDFPIPAMFVDHRRRIHYIRVMSIICTRGVANDCEED